MSILPCPTVLPRTPAASFPSPLACPLGSGQAAAQTQQEETGVPGSVGKSVWVAERGTLQHLQLLGDAPGPTECSRLQESRGDRRSSTSTSMCVKKKREERGKYIYICKLAIYSPSASRWHPRMCSIVHSLCARLLAHQRRLQPPLSSGRRGSLEGSAALVESRQRDRPGQEKC